MSQVSVPTEEAPIPVVTAQTKAKVPGKGTVMWSGLSVVQGRAISSLTSGRVSVYADDLTSSDLKLGAPALTLSTLEGSSHIAVAGKELEVCVLDAEAAFSSTGKRKADGSLPGQVWCAKNLPHNQLRLRQPVYHLASTFLDAPSALLTGTKAGQVRRYDTRQRKPVANWAVGKDGAGVQGLVRGSNEHEVFFSDLANTLGALDLRTGRPIYEVPGLAATTNWMTTIPHEMDMGAGKWGADTLPKYSFAGLASVSSDATLRVCQTTPPPADAPVKGNWNTSGNKKSAVIASVGGVGVGSCVFDGFGSHTEIIEKKEKEKKVRDGDDDDDDITDEEVDDDEEEELWEGMGEAPEGSDEEDDESEEEEDEPARKRRK